MGNEVDHTRNLLVRPEHIEGVKSGCLDIEVDNEHPATP